MRLAHFFLLLFAAAAASSGTTLTNPFVEVRFGGSGHPDPIIGHILGGGSDATNVSASRTSGPDVVANYILSGTAGFGALKVSSEQFGLMGLGTSRARNAVAFSWDKLMLTVPGSSETTYRWQPTIRLSGLIDWTSSGTPGTAPAGVEVAQSVRVEGQTGFTNHPHQVDLLAEGVYDDLYVLPEVTVPANAWFNYRLLLAGFSIIQNANGLQITGAKADFSSTLQVVGLSVKDSSGNALPFQVQAASGAVYSADGITHVPEPASVALVGFAGALLLFVRNRRSR